MNLDETCRRLGLGRLAYRLFHQPLGRVRTSLRNGGPFVEHATARNRLQMEEAACRLPPLPVFQDAPTVTLHLMTGTRFWFQTVFCLQSFSRAARANVQCELYDDGSINQRCAEHLGQLGPTIRIHTQSSLQEKLDALLPSGRYPALRERWMNYPNIRKLIDVHLGSSGWKLVIDSDVLFFRRPDAILAWLGAPQCPLHAVDCVESYGYSRPLLESVAGAPLAPRVNVGVCGLRSEDLDWERLERWTAELQERERTSYYLEQALVAMLTAGRQTTVLNPADYITGPSNADVAHRRGVMQHYVDTSKRWYFRDGWRQCLEAWTAQTGARYASAPSPRP